MRGKVEFQKECKNYEVLGERHEENKILKRNTCREKNWSWQYKQ
jgi:hypothetical protein